MGKLFTKLDREELFIIGGAGFLLIIVAILSTLLMNSMRERESVMLQYDAEQAMADFLFRIQEGSYDHDELFSEDSTVRGLAIYTHTGELIVGIGMIPDTLDLDTYTFEDGNLAEYNKATGTIEYLRRAKIAFTATQFMGNSQGESYNQINIPLAEILYISFDGAEYRSKLLLGRVLNSCLLLLLLGAFLSVLKIFMRNHQYREKLAQQESLVSMGEAARTLAHEIKNPLSAISLQSAVLKKTIPEEYVEGIAVIENEVQRLNSLSNRVGEFLKNPIGEPEKIDVKEFLEEICSRFSCDIPVTSEGKWPEQIVFDRERARSVFENLIKNAVESCEGRDPEVSIEIHTTRSEVQIRILDRGDGLPEGGEKQLFDPFFTTKIHGSGIGLAITRRFVLAAGGTITLRARDGGGTVAEIVVPRST